jgi:aspartate kinase
MAIIAILKCSRQTDFCLCDTTAFMGMKVSKFGGTSVADATQLRKVQAIVRQDPERRIIVVSAPGKRNSQDAKITDLLYRCHECVPKDAEFGDVFRIIADRFRGIVRDLAVDIDIEKELAAVREGILKAATPDFAASRGEYLNGRIAAALLGSEFVDPAEIIRFDSDGRFLREETDQAVAERLPDGKPVVVPGFYGAMPDGSIKTFSRGGSDITGALLARGVRAQVYENWTDVSGVLMADPRIVAHAKSIPTLTYRELRELSYMGANVLHEEAVFPVIDVGIPVRVLNTNAPQDPGTLIVDHVEGSTSTVTGIAGRHGYTVIGLEKNLMNSEVGFGRRLLSALERRGVSFEHMPTGIDAISLVVESTYLKGKLDAVLEEIREECRPDRVQVFENMALIATVGRGMRDTPGVAGRLFGALATAGVNVRMIDQGSSGINIIIGVDEKDFDSAIRSIYGAFANQDSPQITP